MIIVKIPRGIVIGFVTAAPKKTQEAAWTSAGRCDWSRTFATRIEATLAIRADLVFQPLLFALAAVGHDAALGIALYGSRRTLPADDVD